MNIPRFTAEVSLYNNAADHGNIQDNYQDQLFRAGHILPQFCSPRRYPCYQGADGHIEHCVGLWCTDSGWEPGAG
jgi:hypothetical protein